jgi:hypothetical protein
MVVDVIKRLISKHLFIIDTQKLVGNDGAQLIERMAAKHPLLKPEFIIVNDQVHGFKKTSSRLKSLEEFPIFVEMDLDCHDDEIFLNDVDIYAETRLQKSGSLSDVYYLAKLYSEDIVVEHIRRLHNEIENSLIIRCNFDSLITDSQLDFDVFATEEQEGEMAAIFEKKLKSFCTFLKLLDSVIIKGKKLNRTNPLFQFPHIKK